MEIKSPLALEGVRGSLLKENGAVGEQDDLDKSESPLEWTLRTKAQQYGGNPSLYNHGK